TAASLARQPDSRSYGRAQHRRVVIAGRNARHYDLERRWRATWRGDQRASDCMLYDARDIGFRGYGHVEPYDRHARARDGGVAPILGRDPYRVHLAGQRGSGQGEERLMRSFVANLHGRDLDLLRA